MSFDIGMHIDLRPLKVALILTESTVERATARTQRRDIGD
jgi:hypothetical protein